MSGHIGLPPTSQAEYETLKARNELGEKPLTAIQQGKLKGLQSKVDNPDLPAALKKAAIEAHIKVAYGRRPRFTNKYVKKGTQTEEAGIDFYNRMCGLDCEKNEMSAGNKYLFGYADIIRDARLKIAPQRQRFAYAPTKTMIYGRLIEDHKSAYDLFTFEFSEMSATNEAQLRAYMWLYDANAARCVFTLQDMPYKLFLKEKYALIREHEDSTDTPEFERAYHNLVRRCFYTYEACLQYYTPQAPEFHPDIVRPIEDDQRIKLGPWIYRDREWEARFVERYAMAVKHVNKVKGTKYPI